MISRRRSMAMASVFGALRNWSCAAAIALAAILLLPPCAGADDLPNQGAIDTALNRLTEAEQAANDNVPGNSRVKDAEDALDAATRANEETSSDDVKAKTAAQTAEANARAAADAVRSAMADRTSEDQKARAAAYREALRQRREARQALKPLLAELQNFLQRRRSGIGGTQDIEAAINRLRGRIGRAASIVVFTPTQTGFVPPQGSPFANCSFGQAGCSFSSLPVRFKPVFGRAAADSPAYCTYGTATPAPTMFTPSDEFGNPIQPPMEIGDTPRGGPQSAMNDPGNPRVQTGDDGNNTMDGTRGPDDIAGGKGKDEFWFTTNPHNPNDPNTTLNDGDRIHDYESGEGIVLTGTRLGEDNVKVSYDPEKDETRLEIDFPDPVTGRPDGKPDKTLLLNGDKRGTVNVETNCCSQATTEIRITIPRQGGSQPRQAGGEQMPAPAPRSAPQQSAPQSTPPEAPPSQPSTPRQATPSEQSAPEKQPGASAGDPNQGMTIANNPVTIHIKATEAVLAGEATGTELKGEVVKLFAKQEPSLPGTGPATRTALDKGFDKPPVTCTTGADGQCKAQIAGEDREIYGFPATGSPHYRGDLALKKNTGAVIQKASGALTPAQLAALGDVPPGAQLVKSDFKIGNKAFTRIGVLATDAVAADFLAKHAKTFGAAMQTDYCGEKKPGPPLGIEPVSYDALHSELPQQVVTLSVAVEGKRR